MKFKIGDRVNVYGGVHSIRCATLAGLKALVVDDNLDNEEFPGEIRILLDGAGVYDYENHSQLNSIWVHPKQCRKLIKRDQKKIWVNRFAHDVHPLRLYHIIEDPEIHDVPNWEDFDEYVKVKK